MLSSSEPASPEHGPRSGSQHSTIGNAWQHGAEMVVSPGGKKTTGAHKRPRRTLPREPAARFPLWPEVGQARDALRLTARIYNSHAQRSTSGAVSQVDKGVLLRIGGNCSSFRAKPAHISGHLPPPTGYDVVNSPNLRTNQLQ